MNTMNKTRLSLLLGVVIAASGSAALAQDATYVGIHGIWSDVDDIDFQVAPGTIDTEFDGGEGFGITLGRDYGGMRAELEYSWRKNNVDSHSLNGSGALDGSTGEIESTSFMVNGYYDFDSGTSISPYIGAGIGIASIEIEDFGVAAIPDVLTDDDDQFAYQIMLGASLNLDGWQLFTEYRYFATEDSDVTTSTATGGVDNSIGYESNDFLVGARFMF